MPHKPVQLSAPVQLDPNVEAKRVGDFVFPLGVYPLEPMTPTPGFAAEFEPADDDDGLEEWPDRYVYDILISADRLPALCRALFGLLPGRVYPILDVLGSDAYREVDPYVAYDLVGIEHFYDALRLYEDYLYNDGLVGFGAMCDDPFYYVFIDEHKILTLRCEPDLRPRVERHLKAFGLQEASEVKGADAAQHEHRSVLALPTQGDDRLVVLPDEIFEDLRDRWRLVLNVDADDNVDDRGKPLGLVGWRCFVRHVEESGARRYAEVLVTAASYASADDQVWDAMAQLVGKEVPLGATEALLRADRVRRDEFETIVRETTGSPPDFDAERVWAAYWLE